MRKGINAGKRYKWLIVSRDSADSLLSFSSPALVFVSTDNLSSCSSSSSQSSAMAAAVSPSCSSAKSLCGWCGKQGLKLFTLRTADGSKGFCSELCFSQCRRASFKKNKICNWCKHVRHTVNYVDYFDGKSQLQFCSTKCLGQYKMNILCREIEMIPPCVLQSIHTSSSPPVSPSLPASQTPLLPNSQLPVDLCTKRKAGSQTEGEEEEKQRAEESSRKIPDAPPIQRNQVLVMDSSKRVKSHRKSVDEAKRMRDSVTRASSTVPSVGGHEHHLLAQQLHLRQLQQLQTRLSLTPDMILRSLNGSQAGGQHRLLDGRRGKSPESRSHVSSPAVLSFEDGLPVGVKHHFPCLRPRLHSLPPHCSTSSPLTPQTDKLPPLLRSQTLKSEPASASQPAPGNRKQRITRTSETPAGDSSDGRSSHQDELRAGHPHRPPPLTPPHTPSRLMPVFLPIPVPIPVPVFFFQQRALEKIEQLAAHLKREGLQGRGTRLHELEDKSTQVD